jgi:DNA-binding winged helix-turn-helix (wHTH) protein
VFPGKAPGLANRSYAVLWGAFRLFARQRLLLEGHRPVNIGSRALDILIALITRPGGLVTKRELMSIVWPDAVVVEANLTVTSSHCAARSVTVRMVIATS